MTTRRDFFRDAGVLALGAGLVSRVGAAALPEAAVMTAYCDGYLSECGFGLAGQGREQRTCRPGAVNAGGWDACR
jgi:hypothetical protein